MKVLLFSSILTCLVVVIVSSNSTLPARAIELQGNCTQCDVQEQIESDIERITVFKKPEYGEQAIVFTEPRIKSTRDLITYRSKATRRLNLLPPAFVHSAAVTFAHPLSLKEVEKILGEVNIRQLRYVSKPSGGGETSYPPETENMEQSVAH